MFETKNDIFIIRDYQKQKPFASFLSGIAGPMGIPMWAFYVNRGQLMASFGIRDKNGQMLEFYPANQAYRQVYVNGFRTFVKVDGTVHAFFDESHAGQSMHVSRDQVAINEISKSLGLDVTVTYYTLPTERVAALVRKVEIQNMKTEPRQIEIIDGLAQILPAGLDHAAYKAVSNVLQSWMSAEHRETHIFYKLRASTGDTSEIKTMHEGHFYLTLGLDDPLYISDTNLVFDQDTSLRTPYPFIKHTMATLRDMPQSHVNMVSSAFTGAAFTLDYRKVFYSLVGHAADESIIQDLLKRLSPDFLMEKEVENQRLHEDLVSGIHTRTAHPRFDQYLKQSMLDNIIRGGTPRVIDTRQGAIGYYLYSRKHGDLERDYNFFQLEPNVYSQGNGNFRDVLQNRRNDIFFEPRIGDFNLYQFGSLIQADGYNPLSIEGIRFCFEGDVSKMPDVIHGVLKAPFTPGQLATLLDRAGLPVESTLKKVIKQSTTEIRADYGTGYWEDHFTYLYDLIETYLAVYPDQLSKLLFDKRYPFFQSPVEVVPRAEKYVLNKSGKVRQYGAIRHLPDRQSGWLMHDDKQVEVNLFGKLLILALNKFGHLDPAGIGLSYEAEKPGWNDAMNGLPGLFGSGVSETIELSRLVDFLLKTARTHPESRIRSLRAADVLAHAYLQVKDEDDFVAWYTRMTALEQYRAALNKPQVTSEHQARLVVPWLEHMQTTLDRAIEKAKAIDEVYPTYLTYEATGHTPILDENKRPKTGYDGLPLVKVGGFKMTPLPRFLEAPARYLKAKSTLEEAEQLYRAVRKSHLYDRPLEFYKTSESLDAFGHELGRIRAFTPGWLERESNFLHMTYKYLLGILKAGLYPEFFYEVNTNLTCFMHPGIYGRPPVENSSFLASTVNPDKRKHGQGFYARLTGSTAEVLSMWHLMFLGDKLFTAEEGVLAFSLAPKLPASYFANGKVETRLFSHIVIVYHNPDQLDTFAKDVGITRLVLYKTGEKITIDNDHVVGHLAREIREGFIKKIDAHIGRTA